jgi:hypothetical protein
MRLTAHGGAAERQFPSVHPLAADGANSATRKSRTVSKDTLRPIARRVDRRLERSTPHTYRNSVARPSTRVPKANNGGDGCCRARVRQAWMLLQADNDWTLKEAPEATVRNPTRRVPPPCSLTTRRLSAAAVVALEYLSRHPAAGFCPIRLISFAKRSFQQVNRITRTKSYGCKNSCGNDFTRHLIRIAGRAKLIASGVQSFRHLCNCFRSERPK